MVKNVQFRPFDYGNFEILAMVTVKKVQFWPFDHGNVEILAMVIVKNFWPWHPDVGQMVKKLWSSYPPPEFLIGDVGQICLSGENFETFKLANETDFQNNHWRVGTLHEGKQPYQGTKLLDNWKAKIAEKLKLVLPLSGFKRFLAMFETA